MDRRVRWLRAAYWAGVVTDALAAALLVLIGTATYVETTPRDPDFRAAMLVASALMLGWTVLLLWAERRPVERKGILLITICPVMLGLILAELYAAERPLTAMAPFAHNLSLLLAVQAMLVAVFAFAYWKARGLSEKGTPGV